MLTVKMNITELFKKGFCFEKMHNLTKLAWALVKGTEAWYFFMYFRQLKGLSHEILGGDLPSMYVTSTSVGKFDRGPWKL